MKKYECDAYGYVYNPENGIEPGAAFQQLREDRVCPVCGLRKDSFSPKE